MIQSVQKEFFDRLYKESIENYEAELPILEAMAQRLRDKGENATIIDEAIKAIKNEISRYKFLLNH